MNQNTRSHTGRTHWVMQRLSALIMGPLIFYVGMKMHPLLGSPQDQAQQALASLDLCIPLGVASLVLILHAALGLQVVCEDYAPRAWHKRLIISIKLWAWLLSIGIVWILSSIVFFQNNAFQGLVA